MRAGHRKAQGTWCGQSIHEEGGVHQPLEQLAWLQEARTWERKARRSQTFILESLLK